MTTSLATIQGSQPMDIKFTEHSRYCSICIPLGKTCPKIFSMSFDWDDDEEEEDQLKGEDKDKGRDQKRPQTSPRFFAVMTLTLQPPKPSTTEYFGKMSGVTPIMDAPEEEHRCNTIMYQQEHEDQNQDTLEDID